MATRLELRFAKNYNRCFMTAYGARRESPRPGQIVSFSVHLNRIRCGYRWAAWLVFVFVAAWSMSTHASKIVAPGETTDAQPAIDSGAEATVRRPTDFFVVRPGHFADQSKFLTYGWNGFAGGTVNWRYNDLNRPSAVVASSAAALQLIQTEMDKWRAVCNVQFVYNGTTTNGPSLAPPTQSFDGINVIGWTAQGVAVGGVCTTGVTGVGASGPPDTLVEADIALNYQCTPTVDKTVLHELGHMIGIRHSNVEGAVMSGPNPTPDPSTSYTSLNTLQSDDIAACQALYGPPVATTRTISGVVSNGGGIAGVTFCARPASGVSCTPSMASGAYSCTVPNGWSGVLHAPGPAGLRIQPQTFANVASNLGAQNPVVQTIGTCNLDADNNGLIEAATDGVAILRRLLGFPSGAFSGLAGTCAGNTTSAAIFNATASNFNVSGGSGSTALAPKDGLAIMRAMAGRSGLDVTNGLGLAVNWAQIQSWLNNTCGGSF